MAELISFPGLKEPYAAGLQWRHEDTQPTRKAMAALSTERGAWGVAIKTSAGHFQAGFCDPIAGVKSARKVRPLAPLIVDAHPQPWIGRYALGNDRYWLIAVRDGYEVMPEGDVIGTEREIAIVWEQLTALPDWTEIHGDIEDLTLLAQSAAMTRRPPALRDWRPISPAQLALAAVIAVAIVATPIALWFWHAHTEEVRRAAAAAALAQQRAATRAQQDAIARIPPWTRYPLAAEPIRACQDSWSQQLLALDGWALAAQHCRIDAHNVTVTSDWTRTGGLADTAPGDLSVDGDHATRTDSIASPGLRYQDDAVDADSARRAAWTFVQRYGLKMDLKAAALSSALPGANASNDTTAAVPAWQLMNFTITFPAAPWLIVDTQALAAVPGLRLESIDFDMASQTWTGHGTLYARPFASNPAAASDTAPGSAT